MLTLEQIIRQHVHLPNRNNLGWWPVLCKVCNDHGRKGKRAAFMFEQSAVAYHCFNCDHRAVYDSNEHPVIPDKMVEVLTSFGIDPTEWQPLEFGALGKQLHKTKRSEIQDIEPLAIPLRPSFYPLGERGDNWDIITNDYLERRGVQPASYPFYLAERSDPKWYGRLIIPIYKNDKVIFFQGRDLTDLQPKKYLSPDYAKDKVLYGFDKLFDYKDDTLFVVEGVFDAMVIGGVATLGNKITEAQLKWLNKSPKMKVIIPDKTGKGYLLTQAALENDNWAVSTPDFGDAKDVNAAYVKYGSIYTIKQIMDNISTEKFQIEMMVKLYCKDKPNGRKDRRIRTTN